MKFVPVIWEHGPALVRPGVEAFVVRDGAWRKVDLELLAGAAHICRFEYLQQTFPDMPPLPEGFAPSW